MNKYAKYFNYILRHKWYTFRECAKRGIIWRGLTHDLSKFKPSEFLPYCNYFYGENIGNQSEVELNFDKAWLEHIHRNPHHWQYWVLREDSGATKCLEIPDEYLYEMACDWIGAGIAINGVNNVCKWYHENKDKMKIHESSRNYIEVLIGYVRYKNEIRNGTNKN